jgi:hypothetical protein
MKKEPKPVLPGEILRGELLLSDVLGKVDDGCTRLQDPVLAFACGLSFGLADRSCQSFAASWMRVQGSRTHDLRLKRPSAEDTFRIASHESLLPYFFGACGGAGGCSLLSGTIFFMRM